MRLGSYSIALTVAGMPSFWRLKSMMRYIRLLPPPWLRTVILPLLLRPPRFLIGSSSDSWELAAQNAVREAAKAYHDLRVAQVVEMDVLIENGAIIAYRTKLRLSYKS